jgi:hypothetical protein
MRQGFMRKKKSNIAPAGKKEKKTKDAIRDQDVDVMHIYIYVRLGAKNKYYIASIVEQHNHGLVSPDKTSFLS